MSNEYIAALKEERDFYKAKNKLLVEELTVSDAGIIRRLREWVAHHDKPELYNEYQGLKFYVDKMKGILNE